MQGEMEDKCGIVGFHSKNDSKDVAGLLHRICVCEGGDDHKDNRQDSADQCDEGCEAVADDLSSVRVGEDVPSGDGSEADSQNVELSPCEENADNHEDCTDDSDNSKNVDV